MGESKQTLTSTHPVEAGCFSSKVIFTDIGSRENVTPEDEDD